MGARLHIDFSSDGTAGEGGFSLVEVMVAILILSVISLGSAYCTIMSLKVEKRNVRNAVAQELAVQKMEELAAMNPSSLSSANSVTESNVTYKNISYTRTTSISVNADNSRSITVTVNGNNSSLGGSASISTTYALWGRS